MKKFIFFLLLLFLLTVVSAAADEKINAIENEIKTVLNRVSPSLVKVVSENGKKYVATGIALDNELIITSSLITSHPFEKLYVEDINGIRITAAIIGQDSRSGLTLLRLSQKGPRQLPQARQAAVGDWVALVGLFYDRFPAISQGIISSRSEAELILNAPVAPGSAGGAVVNKKGELLGIIRGSLGFSYAPEYTFRDHSTMIVVGGSKNESGSLCYALPIEKVRRIAEKLKTQGKIVYGWLGISVNGDSSIIQGVENDSPAQRTGIAKGDQIEEISGRPIASFRDIAAALNDKQAGERITIQFKRSGKSQRLDVELGERKEGVPYPLVFSSEEIGEPAWPELPPLPEWSEHSELAGLEMVLPKMQSYLIEFGGARQLGIDIMEITPELSQKLAVKENFGLLISRISEPSAAKKAGLKVGDTLVRANGRECRTADDLRNVTRLLKDKEPVRLELYRDGQLKSFSVIPDKKETSAGDMKEFSEKMQNLKDSIRSEAKIANTDKLHQLRQVREKAESELRRQREQAMLRFQQQSNKLAEEIRVFEAQKNKTNADLKKKYGEQLRRIEEEIKKIQEDLKAELEAKKDAGGSDDSAQK
jgi:S1-C subfamily serine protease